MVLSLDLLQERRKDARVVWTAYQRRLAIYFDKKVKFREFKIGDWVLRNVNLITREPVGRKMAQRWEGPYRIVSTSKNGAYHLVTKEGKPVPRAWNVEHLKKYYF
jgi:hypothetical protein